MTLSGKDRGKMKSVLKTRKVDLKLGKKGLASNFLEEAKKVISVDKMIKVSLDDIISDIVSYPWSWDVWYKITLVDTLREIDEL